MYQRGFATAAAAAGTQVCIGPLLSIFLYILHLVYPAVTCLPLCVITYRIVK